MDGLLCFLANSVCLGDKGLNVLHPDFVARSGKFYGQHEWFHFRSLAPAVDIAVTDFIAYHLRQISWTKTQEPAAARDAADLRSSA
jgi:hypothetical protein